MKAKEMEKLMWKAGIEPNKFSHHFTRMNGSIPDGIEKLINLVEQAALERAAKKCEEISNWRSIWDGGGGASHGADICRQEIRALKDSND